MERADLCGSQERHPYQLAREALERSNAPSHSKSWLRACNLYIWRYKRHRISPHPRSHLLVSPDIVVRKGNKFLFLSRKIREAIKIHLRRPAMNRDQGCAVWEMEKRAHYRMWSDDFRLNKESCSLWNRFVSHIINNLLTSTVRSLRENLKPRPSCIDLSIAPSIRQALSLIFSRNDGQRPHSRLISSLKLTY